MTKKTGGHFRPCNVGSVEAHNERTAKYLEGILNAGLKLYFFKELTHNNESWVNEKYSGKSCAQIFEDMKNCYTHKHGQAPQLKERQRLNKKTGRIKVIAGWSPIREMVVPVKVDTKKEDFKMLREWAERQGINIIRIDIHKDEGHRNEQGSVEENFHAHIVADFFDWDAGTTVKLGPEKMSEMQSILAISLEMERGEKKEDTQLEYLTHQQYKNMMKAIEEGYTQLKTIKEEQKKAESRVKGLSTMLSNLEVQKEDIEKRISILESQEKQGQIANDELTRQQEMLQGKLNALMGKINDREEQLRQARQLLQQVADRKSGLEKKSLEAEKKYNELNARNIKLQDTMAERLKIIEAMDRDGQVERFRQKATAYQEYIFRRWPHSREAVSSIVARTISPFAKGFTQQQALDIENAISVRGDDIKLRESLGKSLLELAMPEMENKYGKPINQKWIEQTVKEVFQIAERTHPLSAVLTDYISESAGGGPSHITDLTDWSGRKR